MIEKAKFVRIFRKRPIIFSLVTAAFYIVPFEIFWEFYVENRQEASSDFEGQSLSRMPYFLIWSVIFLFSVICLEFLLSLVGKGRKESKL